MWHFFWAVKAEGVLGGRLLQAKMLQLQGQLLSLCLEKIMIFVDKYEYLWKNAIFGTSAMGAAGFLTGYYFMRCCFAAFHDSHNECQGFGQTWSFPFFPNEC